jgi:chromosome segregation ATPase
MEFEQIVKRLEWLDEERRKDRATVVKLEERLTALETSINAVSQQIKDLSKDVAEISATAARLNQFNELLARQREDFNKALEEIEKKYQRREQETTKRVLQEFEPIRKELSELKQAFDLTPLQRELKAHQIEQMRLNDAINQLKPRFDEVMRVHEEVKIAQLALDENRRQDLKRIADLQGELSAARKRIEELRARIELNNDAFRNIENRINELLQSEAERKAAQTAFIEQQQLAQIERDRALKEGREQFEAFKKQAEALDAQVAAMDEMLRAAKRAQEAYTEMSTKLERRVNEISEMQRLAEDRLRQEWVSFKADDQKRWTGYSLSQEESMRELRKSLEQIEERITALDDLIQMLQDQLHQTADVTEQQLHEFMNVAHEWLTSYERIMGHGQKTSSKTTR